MISCPFDVIVSHADVPYLLVKLCDSKSFQEDENTQAQKDTKSRGIATVRRRRCIAYNVQAMNQYRSEPSPPEKQGVRHLPLDLRHDGQTLHAAADHPLRDALHHAADEAFHGTEVGHVGQTTRAAGVIAAPHARQWPASPHSRSHAPADPSPKEEVSKSKER